jgi:hypothetical protein
MNLLQEPFGLRLTPVAIQYTVVLLNEDKKEGRKKVMGIILIVILVILLVGTLPTWGHSKSWGPYPSGGIGLILLILIVLLLMGRI